MYLANKTVTDWNNYPREISTYNLLYTALVKIRRHGKAVKTGIFKKHKNKNVEYFQKNGYLLDCKETNKYFIVRDPSRKIITFIEV